MAVVLTSRVEIAAENTQQSRSVSKNKRTIREQQPEMKRTAKSTLFRLNPSHRECQGTSSELLSHRSTRLIEQLVKLLAETIAEVWGATPIVTPSDAQNTEFMHRSMVRLDHLIMVDPQAAEVHRRLSLQNLILSFFLVRIFPNRASGRKCRARRGQRTGNAGVE